MAKLKFGNGLQFELPLPKDTFDKDDEVKETLEARAEANPEVSAVWPKRYDELVDEKLSEINLTMVSIQSEINHNLSLERIKSAELASGIAKLQDEVSRLSRPIVKEIKLNKDITPELEAMEKSTKKSIDAVSDLRKEEIAAVAKNVIAGNKLQSLINFIIIGTLVVHLFLK